MPSENEVYYPREDLGEILIDRVTAEHVYLRVVHHMGLKQACRIRLGQWDDVVRLFDLTRAVRCAKQTKT